MMSLGNQHHSVFYVLSALLQVFSAIIIGLFALSSYATEPPETYTEDIYHESTLVLNQSEVLRLQATSQALAAVIVRASGSEQAIEHTQVKAALQAADDYLYQHAYQSTTETLIIAGSAQPARRLLMQFSAARVQQLLREAGLPIWPNQRTQVLLWMVTDDGGKRLAVADSKVVVAFKHEASQRGLPLVKPLLDLEDRQRISAARIWAEDEASIINASKRYPAKAILSGQVKFHAGEWQARFILIHQQQRQTLKAKAASLALLSESIIAQATSYFVDKEALITLPQVAQTQPVPSTPKVSTVIPPVTDNVITASVIPKAEVPSTTTKVTVPVKKPTVIAPTTPITEVKPVVSAVPEQTTKLPIGQPVNSLPKVNSLPPAPKAPSIPSPPMGETVGLSDAPGLKIIVDNIRNFTAYTALVKHLKALPMVDNVSVDDVRGAKLLVRLTYIDSEARLINALQNSEKLTLSTSANNDATSSDLLFFLWH